MLTNENRDVIITKLRRTRRKTMTESKKSFLKTTNLGVDKTENKWYSVRVVSERASGTSSGRT